MNGKREDTCLHMYIFYIKKNIQDFLNTLSYLKTFSYQHISSILLVYYTHIMWKLTYYQTIHVIIFIIMQNSGHNFFANQVLTALFKLRKKNRSLSASNSVANVSSI